MQGSARRTVAWSKSKKRFTWRSFFAAALELPREDATAISITLPRMDHTLNKLAIV